MSNVVDLEKQRVRRALDRSLDQVRSTGWSVSIVEDHVGWCVADVFAANDVGVGGGAVTRMLIDPGGLVAARVRAFEDRARGAAGGSMVLGADDHATLELVKLLNGVQR